jgi:hypothetical protein
MLLLACSMSLGGCFIMALGGVMAQNFEYQKLLEVPPQYAGLENQRVAVVVDADLSLLYQHPQLIPTVSGSVAGRLSQNVPGAIVVPPQVVVNWQYRTPRWSAMPFGQIAEALDVDRVVYIDIYEYRLNPPGNTWLWDGFCAADVGVIERDAIDPDLFAMTFQVQAKFPDIEGLGRESANQAQIATGVLTRFVQEAAWIFYTHQRPKYPDKYQETG